MISAVLPSFTYYSDTTNNTINIKFRESIQTKELWSSHKWNTTLEQSVNAVGKINDETKLVIL